MANCPHCGANIDEDFGLVDCPGCGASLFVDIDGNIQAYGDETPVDGEPSLPAEQESSLFHDATQDENPDMPLGDVMDSFESDDNLNEPIDQEVVEAESIDDWQDQESLDAADLGQDYAPLDELSGADSAPSEPETDEAPEWGLGTEEAQSSEVMDEPSGEEYFSEEPQWGEESSEEELSGQEPVPPPEPSVYGGASQASVYETEDLSEISDFANSEVSQAREGNLRYNILISGIDTADIREALKEALTDKRFIWDTDALIRSIQSGCLRIEEVTSVKAFVLVSRVSDLPIDIEWEQYAINEV